MPYHDVQCSLCGEIINNYYASPWPSSIRHADGGELEILWHSPTPRDAAVHSSERTVVYLNPQTDQVAYPGKADADMPSRYRKAGFQKVAFETARELEKFEKKHKVVNEGYWYNSGNGS